ncbi:MAG: hypothetical protein WD696_20515 [Bryobacteraceae bacterium]
MGTLRGSFDNVNVPRGRNCTLIDSRVQGTVYVRSNASVSVYRTVILGNVQAEGARFVRLYGTGVVVNGSVQIKYGTQATTINPGTQIGGNVQYVESSGFLKILRARVGQDVQVFENVGGASIYYNVINGNLQCKENDPAPTGDNNQVGGNKEDQCSTF